MNVVRVQTPSGSHIEPPLDQSWDKLTKLRWHAAVAMEDTGHAATIRVDEGDSATRYFGVWLRDRDQYDITVGGTTAGLDGFRAAWDYINGIRAGIAAVRREVSRG